MDSQGDRFHRIESEIKSFKEKFDPGMYKKHKLDLLVRISKRIDGFAVECSECQMLQGEIIGLIDNLNYLAASSKESKNHHNAIKTFINHLKKKHKLTVKGEYTRTLIGAGLVIGVALGFAMDNIGAGIAIGISIGVGMGSAKEAKAKKEDRII